MGPSLTDYQVMKTYIDICQTMVVNMSIDCSKHLHTVYMYIGISFSATYKTNAKCCLDIRHFQVVTQLVFQQHRYILNQPIEVTTSWQEVYVDLLWAESRIV